MYVTRSTFSKIKTTDELIAYSYSILAAELFQYLESFVVV